jgi:hypothetical protein
MAIQAIFSTILCSVSQFQAITLLNYGSQLFASTVVWSVLPHRTGAVLDPSTMEKPVDLSGPYRSFRKDRWFDHCFLRCQQILWRHMAGYHQEAGLYSADGLHSGPYPCNSMYISLALMYLSDLGQSSREEHTQFRPRW